MQHILIVENDSTQLEKLKDAITKQYAGWQISTAIDFDTAREQIQNSISSEQFFTLFLLNVRLSKENEDRSGFLLAQMIRENRNYYCTPLLFLSSLTEERGYALSEFHCYDYISKPYTTDTVLSSIHQMLFTGYLENTIDIMDTYRIRHRILINEILTVTSNAHILIINTVNKQYLTREYTLKSFHFLLGDSFLRCHKCHIINKNQITSYDKVTRTIHIGNLSASVGRNYYESVKKFLL